MQKILRSALVGTTVGAIGLAACDAAPPPNAADSKLIESKAIAAGETLSDVVREALAEILRDKDPYSRARRLAALLPTLGPELVPVVKPTFEDPRFDLTAIELELLMRYWATHQPEDAARWALANANPLYRGAVVSAALRVWAEADPQAAVAVAWPWGDDHPDLAGDMQRALVSGWFASNDLANLRQFIQDLGMGIPRQRAIATYVRVLIQTQGVGALFQWAESLPEDEGDESYKLEVYRQTVGMLQRFDHDAALRWCDAHCDGPYGKNVRNVIASRWARTDGPAALAWLSGEPAGYETNLAVRTSFAEWSRRDRQAALGWMAAHTTGGPTAQRAPWLEPIVPVYALLLAEDSPADAIQWANQVQADEDREWVLVQVARAWRRVDEAAAEAWLVQSPLSEDARAKARVSGPKRRKSEDPQQNG